MTGPGPATAPGRSAPTVLALDAAGAACSAALLHRGRLAGHRLRAMARGHAEALIPMATMVMAEGELGFADLDLIAVTVGPGAFTGLRIGLAAARGLALAADRPLLGVTTFAAAAEAVPSAERAGRPLVVLLDSKRGDLFAQRFDAGLAPVGEPAVLPVDALAAWLPDGPLLATGDGLALARPALDRRPDVARDSREQVIDAADVARIAARQFAADPAAAPPALPLYLRAPAVTVAGGPAETRSDRKR